MTTTDIDEQKRLEDRKSDLQETINTLQTDPTPIIDGRVAELEQMLNTLSEAKGPDRTPQSGPYPEVKTVWQQRRDELMQIRNHQTEWVDEKIQELQSKLEYVNQQLGEL